MTRAMYDALWPNNIPASTPTDVLIAAYLGHADNPQSYAQAVARFPNHQIVSIASHNAVDAQVLDIENGAVDPTDYATINNWDARQLARGVYPTHYCNTSTYPSIRPHLLVPSNWWAAKWGAGPNIPAGAVGVQYTGVTGYDISVMDDFIEGIDMALIPADEPIIAAGALSRTVVPSGSTQPEPVDLWLVDGRNLILEALAAQAVTLAQLQVQVAALTPGAPGGAAKYTGTVNLSPVVE